MTAAMLRPEKRKLSKSILEMKFMKKSKDKAEKDEEEEEGRAVFTSEVTEAMRIGSNRFVVEPSFVPCEDLACGRLSYHGMNPEIERLLMLERGLPVDEKPIKQEADVDDSEMAEHYNSMVDTMAKKFRKKSERHSGGRPPAKRAKFLKPED